MAGASSELQRLEALAETAYAAMYDARSATAARDCFDDALLHFAKAIDAADRGGFQEVSSRLKARRDHVRAVFDNQFRGVG